MDRFTKLILTEVERGSTAVGQASRSVWDQLDNKQGGVDAYVFKARPKKGNEFSIKRIHKYLPNSNRTSQYGNGKYVYVIGTSTKPKKISTEEQWPIWIYEISKSPLSYVLQTDWQENNIGRVGKSWVITRNQYNVWYDEFKGVKADKATAEKDEKDRIEKAARAKEEEIQQYKTRITNKALNGPIDINNIQVKGSEDAKAFQELLWQGAQLDQDLTQTEYKDFANYRNKGDYGFWDGDIGEMATKKFIGYQKFIFTRNHKSTDSELISAIRNELKKNKTTTESINYFKGTAMHIRLKDIIIEHVKKLNEQEYNPNISYEDYLKAIGAQDSSSSNTSSETKPTPPKPTPPKPTPPKPTPPTPTPTDENDYTDDQLDEMKGLALNQAFKYISEFLVQEEKFWDGSGKGVDTLNNGANWEDGGLTHADFFKPYNKDFFQDDDEKGAADAWWSQRQVALEQLRKRAYDVAKKNFPATDKVSDETKARIEVRITSTESRIDEWINNIRHQYEYDVWREIKEWFQDVVVVTIQDSGYDGASGTITAIQIDPEIDEK